MITMYSAERISELLDIVEGCPDCKYVLTGKPCGACRAALDEIDELEREEMGDDE